MAASKAKTPHAAKTSAPKPADEPAKVPDAAPAGIDVARTPTADAPAPGETTPNEATLAETAVDKPQLVEAGTDGARTADSDSEIPGALESRPSGWVITCTRRDRGLWRAGRFWPPEPMAVADGEISAEQFAQLRGEKLLHIEKVN